MKRDFKFWQRIFEELAADNFDQPTKVITSISSSLRFLFCTGSSRVSGDLGNIS